MRILIFGDDRDQLEFDAFVLRQAGFQPLVTTSDDKLLALCGDENPDLILLDAISEETDLSALAAKVRAESDALMMLASTKDDEGCILHALGMGVDDYLVKPHSPQMLVGRAKALLRRVQPVPLSALGSVIVHGLTLDPERHLVTTPDGSEVRLTNLEFRLLFLLMRNPDRVIPSETIVERVWGFGGEGETSLVKNLVSRVRHKVEPDPANPRYVKTVSGVGYSFSSTESPTSM